MRKFAALCGVSALLATACGSLQFAADQNGGQIPISTAGNYSYQISCASGLPQNLFFFGSAGNVKTSSAGGGNSAGGTVYLPAGNWTLQFEYPGVPDQPFGVPLAQTCNWNLTLTSAD